MRHTLTLLLLVVGLLCGGLPAEATEITGSVISPDGAPIDSASVSIRTDDRDFSVRTRQDGRFVLVLPEGTSAPFLLSIDAAGYASIGLEISDPEQAVRIRLERSGAFHGEIEIIGNRALVGETPVTVSNIGREEIERGYWGQDVPVFLSKVPGFYAYSDAGNDIGYSYFFLRGFDMRRTAVSLNGVPLNDAHSHSVFFIDLADFLSTTGDIQVQRGVGTNLYGHSALGGSVDLKTRTPMTERRLRLATTQGAWNTSRLSLEYDTGLIDDKWAATFRYSRMQTDGYRDQSWTESWNYFGSIEHYGDRSTTRFVMFGGPEDSHLAYDGISKEYLDGEVTGDKRRDRRHNPLTYPNEVDHFFQPHFQLHNSLQLRDDLVLQNSFFYFEGDGFFEQYKTDRYLPEYGMEPFPGPGGELIYETDLVRRRHVDEWDGGWIPYLEWQHGAGRGQLQTGVALRLHSGTHWGETTWAQYYPPDLPPNQRYYDYRLRKQTIQPFVQETWTFNDKWSAMAGLTWTSHRYEMDRDQRKGVELTERYQYLLPRLGVTYRPARDWSLFANVSRGGREPAFRDIYDPQDFWFGDPNDLEPEDLVDYELGAVHVWPTGSAQLNFYWLDFANAIVFAGGLDNNGNPATANGAVVDQKGVEFELAWYPVPRWGGTLGLAYNNAKFTKFSEYGWDGSILDHSSNTVAATPEILGTLQINGGFGPVDLTMVIRHVSEFYLDNTEDNRKAPEVVAEPGYVSKTNEAFTTVDLSARVDLGVGIANLVGAKRILLDARVNNLFDELYTTFGFAWPDPVWIPAATRSAMVGVIVDW
ncbi:MAG: TonB-dependent receptor [bacterium]|nr:TonB-dependent receptor [bacterium]